MSLLTIKAMNAANARSMPKDAPVEFIKPRWEQYVVKDDGIDRRFYELCALSELKNALRSGDVWVPGSRQFKDFEEYLLPPKRFAALRDAGDLSQAIDTDGERYQRLYRSHICSMPSAWLSICAKDTRPQGQEPVRAR